VTGTITGGWVASVVSSLDSGCILTGRKGEESKLMAKTRLIVLFAFAVGASRLRQRIEVYS
jgi:hypothetical protein